MKQVFVIRQLLDADGVEMHDKRYLGDHAPHSFERIQNAWHYNTFPEVEATITDPEKTGKGVFVIEKLYIHE